MCLAFIRLNFKGLYRMRKSGPMSFLELWFFWKHFERKQPFPPCFLGGTSSSWFLKKSIEIVTLGPGSPPGTESGLSFFVCSFLLFTYHTFILLMNQKSGGCNSWGCWFLSPQIIRFQHHPIRWLAFSPDFWTSIGDSDEFRPHFLFVHCYC